MILFLSNSAWLDVHYDPVASLYTFSNCMGELVHCSQNASKYTQFFECSVVMTTITTAIWVFACTCVHLYIIIGKHSSVVDAFLTCQYKSQPCCCC